MRFNSFSVLLAIFPGYYTGRALHVHVKVFPDWEVLPNNSFRGGSLAHVGQFFFDDDLEAVIDEVRLLQKLSVDVSSPAHSFLSPFLYLSPFIKTLTTCPIVISDVAIQK
jgi:hypothetical protein